MFACRVSGATLGVPKSRIGDVEAIRVLTVARRSAASERIVTLNQLRHAAVMSSIVGHGCSNGGVPPVSMTSLSREWTSRGLVSDGGLRHAVRERLAITVTNAIEDTEELEPAPIDEERSVELRSLSSDAVLRANPIGEARCGNCVYYLEPTADLSYCWHPRLRILVGAQWWCQWWDNDEQ